MSQIGVESFRITLPDPPAGIGAGILKLRDSDGKTVATAEVCSKCSKGRWVFEEYWKIDSGLCAECDPPGWAWCGSLV